VSIRQHPPCRFQPTRKISFRVIQDFIVQGGISLSAFGIQIEEFLTHVAASPLKVFDTVAGYEVGAGDFPWVMARE